MSSVSTYLDRDNEATIVSYSTENRKVFQGRIDSVIRRKIDYNSTNKTQSELYLKSKRTKLQDQALYPILSTHQCHGQPNNPPNWVD